MQIRQAGQNEKTEENGRNPIRWTSIGYKYASVPWAGVAFFFFFLLPHPPRFAANPIHLAAERNLHKTRIHASGAK